MYDMEWLRPEQETLGAAGLWRDPGAWELRARVAECAQRLGVEFVDAASNDYLGVGAVAWGPAHVGQNLGSVSRETSGPSCPGGRSPGDSGEEDGPRCGGGASRLLGGTFPEHLELEQALAHWTGQAAALLFSSGYSANVGLLGALPQNGDYIFSDRLNHASIVDGCRLSKATTCIYEHLALEELSNLLRSVPATSRKYVVTESYFSMDGDTPDLPRLRELCSAHDACLIVDEAHALGVFGPKGSGLCSEARVVPDVLVGTLGKSLGLHGAFVAGPALLRSWLWNRARSFVFSTATLPVVARRGLFHVKQVQDDDDARARLMSLSVELRAVLQQAALPTCGGSHGPIVPILLGSNERAIAAAELLQARGILAFPVRPPTVPAGTARLRVTLSSAWSDAAFAHVCSAVRLLPRSSAA